MIADGRFKGTTDFTNLKDIDCIIICVPTPLNKHREPDLSFVFNTTRSIAEYLRKGQLIVLESTTYPGTTDEDMKKVLPPTPPSSPITDLNRPSMVEKVEGGHTCRKKLPRRRDGRMRPVAGAAEMGAVGRFRGGGYFMR